MKIFNYGIKNINEEKFIIPTRVNEQSNKVNGGLWGCPKNDLYSDWFVLTLFVTELVPKDHVVTDNLLTGNLITIKDDAKVLTLTKDNYNSYIEKGKLIFDKLKGFDVIHFTKDIMDLKEFEAYYFESYQILNYSSIEKIEKYNMDVDYITSEEFVKKSI